MMALAFTVDIGPFVVQTSRPHRRPSADGAFDADDKPVFNFRGGLIERPYPHARQSAVDSNPLQIWPTRILATERMAVNAAAN
jgi:hypothetical protein